MNLHHVAETLAEDEGFKPHAYLDSQGYWTIGHGICIDKYLGCGITKEESRYLMVNRLGQAEVALDRNVPWWRSLSDARQEVLLNMAYNLGIKRLLNFEKMLAACQAGDFAKAAEEMLDSLWRKQVGQRAERLATMMREGVAMAREG